VLLPTQLTLVEEEGVDLDAVAGGYLLGQLGVECWWEVQRH